MRGADTGYEMADTTTYPHLNFESSQVNMTFSAVVRLVFQNPRWLVAVGKLQSYVLSNLPLLSIQAQIHCLGRRRKPIADSSKAPVEPDLR